MRHHRRLDFAKFQRLQALIADGVLQVSDALAGAVRARRAELGRDAARLAREAGLGDDELARYARGACEISATKLVRLAEALDVDLVWFIENEPAFADRATPDVALGFDAIAMDAREGLALMQAFAAIRDPKARRAVLDLAERLAGDEEDGE